MIPVIAIIDVGKTNKKVFLVDRHYRLVWERTQTLAETVDDDGDPCEDLGELVRWVLASVKHVLTLPEFAVQALNFTTYGASLVYINKNGETIDCLRNYLKPYPDRLREQFYAQYGPADQLSVTTASPALDSLNSGLQLYRLKHERADLFAQVAYALHLPQYMSYLMTNQPVAELTSVGCHTMLWDFEQEDYHEWVRREQIDGCLSVLAPSDSVVPVTVSGQRLLVGVGLHDSSAALIPYLASFSEPFVLISTGTWCISMNPFTSDPLTADELRADCLTYLTYKGQPVKAARLFAGHDHEQHTKQLAAQYQVSETYYKQVRYDAHIMARLQRTPPVDATDYETAYHHLMLDLVARQVASTRLVMLAKPGQAASVITQIFVDGGFSQNSIYMTLLAAAFPGVTVWAASVAQSTALGAALAIHDHWNPLPVPLDLITLTPY